MKKTQLRQIIKEEISKSLKEEYDPNQDPENKGSEAYRREVWKGQFGTMDGYDKAHAKRMSNNKNLSPEEEKTLIYILKMKLKDYEETGDEFFAEEIEIVTSILNKIS